MKRRALSLIAAILLALLPQLAALAEEGGTDGTDPSGDLSELVSLTAETVEGAAVGETVSVRILIDRCSGVDSLEMRINYDADALKLKRIVNGDVFESEFLITNPEQAGLVRAAAASAYGLTKTGTLLTLEFSVLKETGSAVVLTDVAVTRTDPENGYVQTGAYLFVTDGGVSAGGTVPALSVTPWPAPTLEPTPTPEPTATPAAPEKAPVAETAAPVLSPTAAPEPVPVGSSVLELFAAALAAIAILIVVILLLSRKKSGR